MPEAWSNKDERQYEHIKKSAKKKGRSAKRAKEIAAATVNKERSAEGRTKKARKKRKKTSKKRGGK
jgi:ABC-type Fe3+-hydroxamate transport system substrate-binding protein